MSPVKKCWIEFGVFQVSKGKELLSNLFLKLRSKFELSQRSYEEHMRNPPPDRV